MYHFFDFKDFNLRNKTDYSLNAKVAQFENFLLNCWRKKSNIVSWTENSGNFLMQQIN